MPRIARYKVKWSGFSGAPGYSVFHMRDFVGDESTNPDVNAGMTRLDDFFLGITSYLPAGVTVQVQNDVEILDEATGELIDIANATTKAARTGNNAATITYAAAVGAVITWRTPTVREGRRIRGRTFLVPFSSAAFQADGTLAATTVSGLTSLATTLVSQTGTPDLGIYARPRKADPERGITALPGLWSAVTAFSVPDMGAVLRSRRD